jgi:long-chain fatty acid transport protein
MDARQWIRVAAALGVAVCLFSLVKQTAAQSFGVETHNTLMPASGGMGGASLALPQDLTSAINGNPATLAQFHGTQFSVSGSWVEPTYNLEHTGGVLPGVGTFAAKSEAQGSAGGNIGVTQDFSALGLPATLGIGFITAAGAGVDFRHVPQSNGTSSTLFVFEMTSGVGVDLSERLSAGASASLGTGMFDGPFVGIGAMAYDYALRGTLGLNYELTPCRWFGFYYQTEQSFTFDKAIRLELPGNLFSVEQDIKMDLPENIGFGIADKSLMDGRLILAVDVLYKLWDDADLWRTLYDNQWVVQTGAQYGIGRCRLRIGYAFAEDPLQHPPGISAGGVTPPGAVTALEYVQGQLAITSQHRLTIGAGVVDVLPGVDFDLMAGGMFHDAEQFGPLTSTSVESYWVGAGLTWRFGRGACQRLPVADEWGCAPCH